MAMGRRQNKRIIFRKASVFAEYAVLIFIITAAIAGVHYFLKRSIQARVKDTSDEYLGHGQGLEWGSSMTFMQSSSRVQKNEQFGGNMQVSADSTMTQTTLTAPVPSIQGWSAMEHKGSALHVQDAPGAAAAPDYPDLEYKDWTDQGWPLH